MSSLRKYYTHPWKIIRNSEGTGISKAKKIKEITKPI